MRTEDYVGVSLLAGMVAVALGSAGCTSSGRELADGMGGWAGMSGATMYGSGGSAASTMGGGLASGGQMATGGGVSGGAPAVGGSPSSGGTGRGGMGTGGMGRGGMGMGGTATGGTETGGTGRGGSHRGGGFFWPTGGSEEDGGTENGGSEETGGAAGAAGNGTAGSAGASLDCNAAMPTDSGTTHCGSYRTGKAGDLSWELWSNAYNGDACITYYDTPAFSAKWNNNNDFLARVGIEWGGKSISDLGVVTAEFTYNKSGSSGGYSYIGVYGWATNPCVEWYIIDDSFNGMPFSPWGMGQKGSATIDGEVYKFYQGMTGGTGGNRCGTSGQFNQFWSVRQEGRSCGVITITKHFEEWKNAGMSMDNILEAKVLVESGGGQGSIEFPIANVTASNLD